MVFSSPRLDTSHRFERWVVASSLWNPPRSCTQRGAVGWVGTMLDGGVKTWSQLQGSAPIVPSLMFEIFRRKWPPWASATRKRGWAVRSLWVPKYNYFMKFFKFLLWSWGIQSHHFMANRWGKSGNSGWLYFYGLQKSLWMVIAAMKLQDVCYLEEKLWQT